MDTSILSLAGFNNVGPLYAYAVWGHEAFEKSDPMRAQLMQMHFLSGGLIGLLTLVRVAIRAFVAAPSHSMAPMIARLAKLTHFGLYFLMLCLPVLGYIAVSGKGQSINLFGLLSIEPLPISKETAKISKELHEGLGNALVTLVTLHIAAALFHAAVLKDGVVQSMTGGKKPKSNVSVP